MECVTNVLLYSYAVQYWVTVTCSHLHKSLSRSFVIAKHKRIISCSEYFLVKSDMYFVRLPDCSRRHYYFVFTLHIMTRYIIKIYGHEKKSYQTRKFSVLF